jgi:NTE family protein
MDGGVMYTKQIFFYLSALLLCGCAVTHVQYAKNDPLPSATEAMQHVARASFGGGLEKPFIGIAISGGGSRAANFGWAALSELSALGILQHADSISSVSGGSIPAALYALNADHVDQQSDWQSYKVPLREDFLTKWIVSLLNPIAWFKLATSDYDRTQILSKIFDSILFKNATFADLNSTKEKSSPRLLINATSSNNPEGVFPFAFTEETFTALLSSRIDTYPIAEAVAASGAFPGVFGNITLTKFGDKLFDYKTRLSSPITTYERLYDGGASDNLGVWTLIARARAAYIDTLRSDKSPPGCMLILIDANAPNFNGQLKSLLADVDHSALDLLIKSTAWDSIDSLLQINRLKTLQTLGSKPAPYNHSYGNYASTPISAMAPDSKETFLYSLRRPVYEPVFRFKLFASQLPYYENASAYEEEGLNGLQAIECIVWHLTFERLRSMTNYVTPEGKRIVLTTDRFEPIEIPNEGKWVTLKNSNDTHLEAELTPIGSLRGGLWALGTNITTSYKLTGPEDCPVELLQESLFLAAKVLVKEDESSTDAVCQWLNEQKLKNGCSPVGPSSTWQSINYELRKDAKIIFVKTNDKPELPIVTCSRTKYLQFQNSDKAPVRNEPFKSNSD